MRVLAAHNRYQFGGGEDAVFRDETELLRMHGHTVRLFEEGNDAIQGVRGKLIAAASIFYSTGARRRMREAIEEFAPDVLHVHNWFPMLSPSIVMEAGAMGIPVVQTLHNYRMLCANAMLYRDGRICTDCVGKSPIFKSILHGCYRGSRAGSAIVSAAYDLHRLARTWDNVDLFIAVSEFQRELLVRGGLPAEKIVVKPNFCSFSSPVNDTEREDHALYVGRLSVEKGIVTLLEAWSSGKIPIRLKIVGDGPLASEVRRFVGRNGAVEYLGQQPPEMVYREMARARFLVFPSEWYETFGRTVVEAFSQGTPVLAADLGCMRGLVEDGVTGYRFEPGNAESLAAGALRFPSGEAYRQMEANCRDLFEKKYTAERNYAYLTEIYRRAIELGRWRGGLSVYNRE